MNTIVPIYVKWRSSHSNRYEHKPNSLPDSQPARTWSDAWRSTCARRVVYLVARYSRQRVPENNRKK